MSKAIKSSRRFTSETTAKRFALTVKGVVIDLRNNKEAKSNFKVTYNKSDAKKCMAERMLGESHPDSYWQ
jgi:hypothetical protein